MNTIRSRATVPALLGTDLRVSIADGVLTLNETIPMSQDESEASNGFAHILPGVLIRFEAILDTVMDVLRSDGEFSRFVALLDDLGLSEELVAPGAYSVFVTNTAMEGGSG